MGTKVKGGAVSRRDSSKNKQNPQSAIRRSKSGSQPLVAVIMGSKSDWDTMRHAADTLNQFGITNECHVISAHRTPQIAMEFASGAEAHGLQVIIAAAGGAAHLAGVLAANTLVPVLGVPMKSDALNGMDSLLSTVQMPAGIPVATLAIGKPGAINAALYAVAILSNTDSDLRNKLRDFRAQQERQVREARLE
jgi:5-(carboxyamino)imidazole ribonucleotide mutase